MEILVSIIVFIYGLVFGSFYNVVGYRLPKGESIVKGIYENLDLLREASAMLREDFSSNQYTDIQGNVKPM